MRWTIVFEFNAGETLQLCCELHTYNNSRSSSRSSSSSSSGGSNNNDGIYFEHGHLDVTFQRDAQRTILLPAPPKLLRPGPPIDRTQPPSVPQRATLGFKYECPTTS